MQSSLKKVCLFVGIHAVGSNGITLKRAGAQYGTAGRDTDDSKKLLTFARLMNTYDENIYPGDDILNLIAKKMTIPKARREFLQQLETISRPTAVHTGKIPNILKVIGNRNVRRDMEYIMQVRMDNWEKYFEPELSLETAVKEIVRVIVNDRALASSVVARAYEVLESLEHLFYILELVNEKKSNDHDESTWRFLVETTAQLIVDNKSKTNDGAYLDQLSNATGIQNVLQALKSRFDELAKRDGEGFRQRAKERSELLLRYVKDQDSGAALRAFFEEVTAKVEVIARTRRTLGP